MDDPDASPVAVPRQVHCELATLRQLGTYDLLSDEVFDALEAYDFEATREWILEHPDRYVRAVHEGTEDETVAGAGSDWP